MHPNTEPFGKMESVEYSKPGQLSLSTTSRTISPFPLLNLPPDLVLCVFDVLAKEGDWCVLTCLGLSCRYLYRTLKDRYYPTPISLDHGFWRTLRSPVKDSDGSTSKYRKINEYFPLVVLVTEFIGPKYRLLSGESPPVFVLKKVYGECDDCGNKREGALRGRRRDFRRMTYYRDGKATHLLPNPFNEGDRWNEQVWERWCDSDKLGWTKEMGEYFTRNLKRCNVWNTLSKRKGPSRLRRWASEGVQKGDGTFDSGGLTLLDSLYYKILVLPVSDAIAKPQ